MTFHPPPLRCAVVHVVKEKILDPSPFKSPLPPNVIPHCTAWVGSSWIVPYMYDNLAEIAEFLEEIWQLEGIPLRV